MALIMQYIDSIYRFMDENGDPRTKDWPMMGSPFPTLGVCLSYVFLVTVLGPRLMKNRDAFRLQNTLIVYNAVQVVFSAWLFYEIGKSGWLTGEYSLRCQPVGHSNDPKTMRMVHACWWYYFSKFTEFFDTIFFILRKKNNQVTKLHVIHHGCMPMSVWFGVKFTPGGHSTFFGLLNSLVHIVMYTYYMFSAMGPQYQRYLWWKKYLTTLQMVQFILIMVHAFQLLFIDCDYPKAFVWWIGMHAVMFFFLFKGFYDAAYKNRRERGAIRANGQLRPNGFCYSINAHDDLAMPMKTNNADAAETKKPYANGHTTTNGLKNGYKLPIVMNGSSNSNSNSNSSTTTCLGNGKLLANGNGTLLSDTQRKKAQ